jgi:hypothetical protein
VDALENNKKIEFRRLSKGMRYGTWEIIKDVGRSGMSIYARNPQRGTGLNDEKKSI